MSPELLRIVLVGTVALASLVIPFLMRAQAGTPFTAADVELIAGKRGVRSVLGASFFLLVILLGTWGAFAEHAEQRYWLLRGGVVLGMLMLVVILPLGRIRGIALRLLEFALVAFGVTMMIGFLLHYWVAASDGRALFPTRGGEWPRLWVTAQDRPGIFWLSVISTALGTCVVLFALREYFVARLAKPAARPASRALPQTDEEAADSGR